MAYKVLGQEAPNGGVDTDLYSAPPGGSAVVSSLTVCNKSSEPAQFRVNVDVGGTGFVGPEGYIYYDVEVQGNSTFVFTGGITLGPGDVLFVRSSADGVLSFSLFGNEIT